MPRLALELEWLGQVELDRLELVRAARRSSMMSVAADGVVGLLILEPGGSHEAGVQ